MEVKVDGKGLKFLKKHYLDFYMRGGVIHHKERKFKNNRRGIGELLLYLMELYPEADWIEDVHFILTHGRE